MEVLFLRKFWRGYAQPYWTGTMVEELARLAERGGGDYRSNRMSWPSNE